MNSPPEGLAKLKMENGYTKEGYYMPRKSSGQKSHMTEYRSRNGKDIDEEDYVKEEKEPDRGTSSSSKSDGRGSKTPEMINTDENDKLVDGWPKWLTDCIAREVLINLVPRSANSYSMIRKVGSGTYSNVYKARDKKSGKIVALKKVRLNINDSESVKFMAREIIILQKLDHTNIVKLEGLATSRMDYSLYLVFDFMPADLSKILNRKEERLTEPQIKCYMNQLLSGLKHCHDLGILHRDIKGSNLLIDKDGMLKIADFGLAKFVNTEKKSQLTNHVVTLWYRAPELLLGSKDYGVGIDLWSAGCLMAEMIRGKAILPGQTEAQQREMIFRLCGTPSDDYYTRLKLSTRNKPRMTYKPSIQEVFTNFPPSSIGLLNILLALDPAHRGSADSALRNEFFHTNPLACDFSGLPIIHIEEDKDLLDDKRKHVTVRRRSRSHKERRKKNQADEKTNKDTTDKEVEPQKIVETETTPLLSFEPRSTTPTSTSSTSAKPPEKEENRLYPSPIVHNQEMSPTSKSYYKSTSNIKNRPPTRGVRKGTMEVNERLDLDKDMHPLDNYETC